MIDADMRPLVEADLRGEVIEHFCALGDWIPVLSLIHLSNLMINGIRVRVRPKLHPHAELMQQWADDHKWIPPVHEWEHRYKEAKDEGWQLEANQSFCPWYLDFDYRRVVDSD